MKKVLAVVPVLLVLSCSQAPEKQIVGLYDKAVRQADQFAFEEAEKTLDRIGRIDPSSPVSYFGRGLLLERQFRFYDALHVHLGIVDSSPAFAPAYRGAWWLLRFLEEYDDAVQMASEYARLLPEDPEAHLIFAEALIDIGQPGRARIEIDTALQLGADPVVAGLARARTYLLEHQFDSVETVYQEAMAGFGRTPSQYAEAAAFFEAGGRIDTAISLSRSAFEAADPGVEAAVRHFFRALKHGYFYEARRTMEALKGRGAPEIVRAALRFHYHLARGEQTQARHANTAYSREAGMCIDALIYDLMVWGKEDDIMTAVKNSMAIEHTMETENYNQTFRDFMRYRAHLMIGTLFDDPTALEKLSEAPSKYLGRREVEVRTAYCYYRTGQVEQFNQRADRIQQFHGTQPDWLGRLGDLYADRFLKQYGRAEELYRQALQWDNWHRPAFENAVQMFRTGGQPDRALKLFDEYPHFERQYPELAVLKAYCLLETGDVDAGLALFRHSYPGLRGNLDCFIEMDNLLNAKDAL
ncbi:MAG: hypothetical protein AB1744_11295, partial [Candidatus Zixiibacteriota bacterium]